MRWLLWVIMAALVMLGPLHADAAMFGPDYKPCGDQPSTMAIVDCLAARTKVWDQRLDSADKSLAHPVDAGQRKPLQAAARLWAR